MKKRAAAMLKVVQSACFLVMFAISAVQIADYVLVPGLAERVVENLGLFSNYNQYVNIAFVMLAFIVLLELVKMTVDTAGARVNEEDFDEGDEFDYEEVNPANHPGIMGRLYCLVRTMDPELAERLLSIEAEWDDDDEYDFDYDDSETAEY